MAQPLTDGHVKLFKALEGKSQTETAKLISAAMPSPKRLSVYQFNHIIRRRNRPTLDQACAIERVLGIPAIDWGSEVDDT